jgi:hemerythrin-like domain-containing protein
VAELSQSLISDHRLIERILNAVAVESDKVERGKSLNDIFVRNVLDFVHKFADGIHHCKEETILFPRMEKAGIPRDGEPLGALRVEHDRLRRTVAAIESMIDSAAGGNGEAAQALNRALQGCVAVWRSHMQWEEHILLPMANRLFEGELESEILASFAEIEKREANSCHRQMAWVESLV